jgi:hypothetical protein
MGRSRLASTRYWNNTSCEKIDAKRMTVRGQIFRRHNPNDHSASCSRCRDSISRGTMANPWSLSDHNVWATFRSRLGLEHSAPVQTDHITPWSSTTAKWAACDFNIDPPSWEGVGVGNVFGNNPRYRLAYFPKRGAVYKTTPLCEIGDMGKYAAVVYLTALYVDQTIQCP